jgi:hypothetical protein
MADQWRQQERPRMYYTLPVTPQAKIELSGPFPLTVEEWERFKQLLDVMEPGLRDGYHEAPAKSDTPAPEPARPTPPKGQKP